MKIESVLRNAGVPETLLGENFKWGVVYYAYFRGRRKPAELHPVKRKFGWRLSIRVGSSICRIRCINNIVKVQLPVHMFRDTWVELASAKDIPAMLHEQKSSVTYAVVARALRTKRPLRKPRKEPTETTAKEATPAPKRELEAAA